MTADVVVAVSGLDNPVGQSASYACELKGFSNSLQRWDSFSESQKVAAFKLTPTPQRYTGSFTW